MTKSIVLPPQFKDLVESIQGPVTSADIDSWLKVTQAEDRSYRLRVIVDAWKEQQSQDRNLRKMYAIILLGILFCEAAVATVAFFLIGYKQMSMDTWVASVFFTAIFTQVAGMVLAIVKYLFPQTSTEVLNLLEKL